MEKSTVVRGLGILRPVLDALMHQVPDRDDRIGIMKVVGSGLLDSLVHVHEIITADRLALAEDIRVLSCVMVTLREHVQGHSPADGNFDGRLVDSGLRRKDSHSCHGSLWKNLDRYVLSDLELTSTVLAEVNFGMEKLRRYNAIFMCTDELRAVWYPVQRLAEDVQHLLCLRLHPAVISEVKWFIGNRRCQDRRATYLHIRNNS